MIEEITLTDESGWTESFFPETRDIMLKGNFNVSVNGNPWTGSIKLQRRYHEIKASENWEKTNWRDVLVFTLNSEQTVEEPEKGVSYRLGTDIPITGTVNLRLSY